MTADGDVVVATCCCDDMTKTVRRDLSKTDQDKVLVQMLTDNTMLSLSIGNKSTDGNILFESWFYGMCRYRVELFNGKGNWVWDCHIKSVKSSHKRQLKVMDV